LRAQAGVEVFSDDFERPDQSDLGPAWARVYGGYRVEGGQAVATYSSDGTIVETAKPLPCVDHYAELEVTGELHDQRVLVRTSPLDPQNPVLNSSFYSFRYFEEAGAWFLLRSEDRGIASLAAPKPSFPYTLRLEGEVTCCRPT